VVQLNRLPATAAAASLRALFATNNKGEPPTIEADEVGRRLLMRGAPEQISQIKKVLTEMGEMGHSGGSGLHRGPLAIVNPRGRSSDDIVSLLERALPRSENQFIRIVSPSDFGRPAKRSPLFDRGDDSSQNQPPRSQRGTFGAGAGNGGRFQRSVTLPPDVPGNEFRREFLERIRTIDDESTARRPQRSSEPEPNTSTGETTQAKSNDQDESPPCGETTAKEADDDKTAADEDDVTKEPASASPQPKRSARTGNPEAAAESNAPKGRPDVQITVDGDRILIYCEDEEELNRIEALIENLAAAPSQTKWTVYRLKTPDSAESTAQMIGSLFPEGTVTPAPQPTTTTTGGRFSSQFGSRGISTDSSGLNTLSKTGTLKIIPDVRLNSLIITGPEDIVGQVLEWVKYFDNAESLADKRTQRFQLKHARVAEVAEHVFELFREEMGFPVQNNMQTQNGMGRGGFGGLGGFGGFGGNALAFNPFGGGGGRGNNQQQNQRQPKIQLSITPDYRTNTLWVVANDMVLQKVGDTIKALDDSVLESKPTVKVFAMSKTNSAVVQQTLAALVEGVHTTTTGNAYVANQNNGNTTGQRGQQQGNGFNTRFANQNMGGQGFGGQGFGGQGFGGQGFGGQGFGGQGFGGQGFGGQGFGGQGFGGRGGGGQGFGGQGFGGRGGGGQGFGGQGFGGGGGGRGGGGGGRGGGGGGRGGQ
jgi:hypothetical protein